VTPTSDMKRKASLNAGQTPDAANTRRRTWFGFGTAANPAPTEGSDALSADAGAPPPIDADEAAFRLALATGATSIPGQTQATGSIAAGAPEAAKAAAQVDSEPTKELSGTDASAKPAAEPPTNPRTTNSRGWFTWRAQAQAPAPAPAPASAGGETASETVSPGTSTVDQRLPPARSDDRKRTSSALTVSSGSGAAKASQPLYASPLRRMWNRSEASPIEEQPETQSEAASLHAGDEGLTTQSPTTLLAGTQGAQQTGVGSDVNAMNTSTWRFSLWPGGRASVPTTPEQSAYQPGQESKLDVLSTAATSDIPSIVLNKEGRGRIDTDSRASTSQPSSSAGPGGYASYIAGWIPGWGYATAQPATSESASREEGEGQEGGDDAPFVPRTPAEQVKADALARPERPAGPAGAAAAVLDTVSDGLQRLADPTDAILNSSTRKSWVSFFASRGAQPVRKLAVEGPEVMDLDEDGSGPASGSASLRAPGTGAGGASRSASPSIAESVPAALRGGNVSAPKAGPVRQNSTATSATSSVILKDKGKAGGGRSPPVSAPTSPTVGPTTSGKSDPKGKIAIAATAASALKTKLSNASLSSRAKTNAAGDGSPSPVVTGAAAEIKDPNAKMSKKTSVVPLKAPNLMLPSFEDTFATPPRVWPPKVGVLERTIQAFNTYLFSKPPDYQRLGAPPGSAGGSSQGGGTGRRRSSGAAAFPEEITQRLPRSWEVMGDKARASQRGTGAVRKIVVLGIHGWFAQFAILKNVMGEPTGTSFKFATEMSEAIHRHFKDAGLELNPEAITVIALEGDGKVADRVHRLSVSLLSNPAWVRDLHEADAIFFSAHSQGTIVGTELLARLIEQKHIQPERTRVCLLAMAGIHEGPLPHLQSAIISSYLTYFETAAAKELFEFQNSTTPCSESYAAALRIILNAGVKAVYVASVDDQVVPLHGALHSAVMHPSILRALFIDSTAFPRADFLTNLLVLCTQVRNAGLNDHEVLSLLSTAVAGSLYSGLGHSNVYEEPGVYDLAVRYLFETTHPCGEPTCTGDHKVSMPSVNRNAFQVQASNPFSLPWAIRGLLEDPDVRELFSEHMSDLLEQFAQWKPTNKAQKDVQLRLSPLKGLQIAGIRPRTTSSAASSKPGSPQVPSSSKL